MRLDRAAPFQFFGVTDGSGIRQLSDDIVGYQRFPSCIVHYQGVQVLLQQFGCDCHVNSSEVVKKAGIDSRPLESGERFSCSRCRAAGRTAGVETKGACAEGRHLQQAAGHCKIFQQMNHLILVANRAVEHEAGHDGKCG